MKMCMHPMLLAVIVGLGIVATAARAEEPKPATPPAPKVVMGTLVRVADSTLYVKNKAGEETAIPTTGATEVYDDGERSTLAALTAGQKIKATMVNGVATKIQSGGKRKPAPAA